MDSLLPGDETLPAGKHGTGRYCSLFGQQDFDSQRGYWQAAYEASNTGNVTQSVLSVRPRCAESVEQLIHTNRIEADQELVKVEQCVQRVFEMVVEQHVGHANVDEYEELLCNEGYQGPVCGVCKDSKGFAGGRKYGLVRPFQCLECKGLHTLWFVFAVIVSTGFLLLITTLNLRKNRGGY